MKRPKNPYDLTVEQTTAIEKALSELLGVKHEDAYLESRFVPDHDELQLRDYKNWNQEAIEAVIRPIVPDCVVRLVDADAEFDGEDWRGNSNEVWIERMA